MARVTYQQEKTVDAADESLSLLQLARQSGIPHVAACGGNARCSTCRVLVLDGLENLTPRTEAEARLALLKGFEPNIRLACQTHARGPATVRRLVWDERDIELALAGTPHSTGREATLAILFSDIRSFTPFAEHSLPYDVVHVLNRYFRDMGGAVLRHGGYIDKYIGDGLMALFGLDADDPARACRQAVLAALDMQRDLPELNRYLSDHFGTTLEIGIGIHCGSVIVAEIGHPRRMQLTAIGDAVNVASRVESATKEVGARLLVTAEVAAALGGDFVLGRRLAVHLKGTTGDRELVEVLAATAPAGEVAQTSLPLRRELERRMARADAPLFLRLAFHDAISFDPREGTGGANGSIRFPEELAREDNRGLDRAVAILDGWKRELCPVSWSDLIALAGAAAVSKCGGPDIDVPLGRTDVDAADPIAWMPDEHADVAAQKRYFAIRGFTTREYVALMGGHTLGRGRELPFTDDLFTFSNSYYRHLLAPAAADGLASLNPDRILPGDPETRALVEEYAADQSAFFRDFAAAYVKLTLLGVDRDGPHGSG
jgi:adenylate cyclase